MDFRKKYPNLKVVPISLADHTSYGDLTAIRGHKNFYVNFISGKIFYRKSGVKIATGCTTIMAAQKAVEAELEKRKTGKSLNTIKKEMRGEINPSIGQIWDLMVADCKSEWTPGTRTTYNTSWKCLKEFWANKTVLEAANDDLITEFRDWYLENHPKRQARKTIQHLNKCLNFGFEKGLISRVPKMEKAEMLDDLVKRNNSWKKKGRPLSVSETEVLVKAIDKLRESKGHGVELNHHKMLHARTKLAIFLGVFCGMRKKEITNLKWSRIDLKKRILEVWSFKNHKWRLIPYWDIVHDALLEVHKFSGEQVWVFPMPSDPKRCISTQVLDKCWFQVRDFCEFEEHSMFHDLRRTFATRTGEWGWPVQQACEYLDMTVKTYMEFYCKPSTESKMRLIADSTLTNFRRP